MSDEAILESDTEDYEAYDEDYGEAGFFGNLGNLAASLVPFPFRQPTRPSPAQVARPTTYIPPAPAASPFVTQAAFSSAMSKIARDVRKNSSAIATVGNRVSSVEGVNAQQTRELAKQSKASARQEKEITGVKKDLKKTNDNALLMTLLSRPKTLSPTTTTANVGGAPVPPGTKLQYTSGNDNSLLLALMLSGGLGGSGGGDDNNMLFLALALSGGL
jgi:hypothetical protein